MRRYSIVSLTLLLLAACSKEEPPKKTEAPPPAPAVAKPADESRRFPSKDRVDVKVVDDHVLGKDMLPGGNVATYKTKGKDYQLFLVKSNTAEKAAILLLDLKSTLADFKFVPSFGGYYGMDGKTPVFIFQKGSYLAGITGLKQAEADKIAREFAARIN